MEPELKNKTMILALKTVGAILVAIAVIAIVMHLTGIMAQAPFIDNLWWAKGAAIAGLVIFLFNDKLPQWQRIVLYSLVPIGLAVYFTHFDISIFVPDELGGQRLQKYRELKEQGLEDEQAGWMLETHILIWMNIVLYYASIYYHDYLAKHFKYTIIAIKLQAVGLCSSLRWPERTGASCSVLHGLHRSTGRHIDQDREHVRGHRATACCLE